MHKLSAALLVVLLRYTQAQDADCDFSHYVLVGRQYHVFSPEYPRNYKPGVQCRWVATCPAGYNCRLDCTDIALPQSPSCSSDRLLISKSGDSSLTDSEYYCGRGSVIAVSTGRKLSAGLITDETGSTTGRFYCVLSAQRASKPTSPSCRCGHKGMNRIVGGEFTQVNEYPMMAGLVVKADRKIECGLVIIDKRYLLTAAHCVFEKKVKDEMFVLVGEHDVTTGSETSAARLHRVKDVIVHPQYNKSTNDYDIAIVKVASPIQFSARVGSVCLPFKFANNDFTGAKVTALGWGRLFSDGPLSTVLRKVDLDIISQKSCAESFESVTARQVCTYTPGKDSCQSDSGGPLLFTDPVTGLIFSVGIVSYGISCASLSPAVNTRVTAVMDWILTSAPADYCIK